MATIIAILLAVMVDRYVQVLPGGPVLARARTASWLNLYLAKCINLLEKLSIKQTYLMLLSTLLPLCIALFLVKLLFGLMLGSLGNLIFIAITLFYFLGFRQNDNEHTSVFVITHEQSFGVLFWFAILGPTGALIYWFLVLAQQTSIMQESSNDYLLQGLKLLHALAAWIPTRITAFLYALVGNFDPGFKTWMVSMRNPKLPSSQVLESCGFASAAATTDGDNERLVTRTFVAWVVLIILIVLVCKGYS